MFDAYLSNLELFLLVFIRASAMLAAMPMFSDRSVPVRVRIGLGLLLGLILTPVLPAQSLGGEHWLVYVGYALREAMVGLLLGFVAKTLFWGVQFAGQVISFQMGFALANVLDPDSRQQVPLISRFKYLVALMFLLVLDGHYMFLAAFKRSFDLIPVGQATVSGPLGEYLIRVTSGVFVVGVKIGAPVMIGLLLTNVAMALMARTVPQMNIFIVAFPIGIAVGFFILIIGIPAFFKIFGSFLGQLERDLILLLGTLQNG
jgi:flagellar biosynthetic protein FliR